MKKSDSGAASQLREWINGGFLASQVATYFNTRIRGSAEWYGTIVATKGRTAAEAALKEWDSKNRISDFGNSLEAVARGMLAMAESAGDHVRVVHGQTSFPRLSSIKDGAPLVVLLNPALPGCGCCGGQPQGYRDWAPGGALGLRAITVEAGYNYANTKSARLGLVLPARNRNAADSFTVVTISPAGDKNTHCSQLNGFRSGGFLLYSLGLATMDDAVSCSSGSGGSFDDGVGFPGASQYLADALATLPQYLSDVAATLSVHENS